MQIKNGSSKLFSKKELNITVDGIRFGEDESSLVGTGIITLFLSIPILRFIFGDEADITSFWQMIPGPWYYYWIIGFIVGIAAALKMPDTRLLYTSDKIDSVHVLGLDRVGTKGIAGSLGGAAVGGVLFGGSGAVVGSIAGGNKIVEFSDIVIKFTDGEWVVVATDNGFIGSLEYDNLLRLAGEKNQCPIPNTPNNIVPEKPSQPEKVKIEETVAVNNNLWTEERWQERIQQLSRG